MEPHRSGPSRSLGLIAIGVAGLCGLALTGCGVSASLPQAPATALSPPREEAKQPPAVPARKDGPRDHPDPNSPGTLARIFLDDAILDTGVYDTPASFTADVADESSLDAWRDAIDGRTRRALASLRETARKIGLDEKESVAAPQDAVALLRRMADVYLYDAEFDKAELVLRRALEIASVPVLTDKDRAEIQALLGITALRRGEQANCIACIGPSSCILPIDPSAVHKFPAGSREAVARFTSSLDLRPGDLRVRWLLNLAYMTLGEYPGKVPPKYLIPLDRFRSRADIGRFKNIATDAGLTARGPATAGGAIFDDFNGDDLPDIFMSSIDVSRGASLFLNRGDGTFDDRSTSAGLYPQVYALNVTAADFDNDGDLDVLLLRGGWERAMPLSLLRNDGKGVFQDMTAEAGLDAPIASESAAWGDYDNDGRLDLFVCGEYQPSMPESRNLCRLYHNEGNGRFVDVADQAGVLNGRYAKGAAWGDFDNDGKLDLWVSNMSFGGPMASRLYHNEGDGKFLDVAPGLGMDAPKRHFTCLFWDYDNDGWLDLLVSDYSDSLATVVAHMIGIKDDAACHPFLYRNLEGKAFQDVSTEVGLGRPISAMSMNVADLDNDGWLDLHMGTGWMSYSGLIPDLTFKNQEGKALLDVTESSGTGHLQKGHGVSFADADGDGNLDLLVAFGGGYPGDRGYPGLFHNRGHPGHWLKIKLIGTTSNRSAIGARIKADLRSRDGTKRTVHRTVGSNGSFGGNSLVQHLGLGASATIDRLVIEWPASGLTVTLRDVAADQFLEVREPQGNVRKLAITAARH